jgi:hypothetical protein
MIIAICGLQGSGKDTIGSHLITKYGFTKLSFAGVLKDIVGILFDWDRDMLEGSTKESREWRERVDTWWSEKLKIPNLTPRYVLQYFGTDLFRNHVHQDIWVISVERQLSKYPNCVITDCRFPNEFCMLQSCGAKMIKITKGVLPEWYQNYVSGIIDKPEGVHPSEYLWIKSKFDYEIENSTTIKDLYERIDSIITELTGKNERSIQENKKKYLKYKNKYLLSKINI